MSETLERQRRRLQSVEELRSVVRTMKRLAAASLRQHEAAALRLGEYFRTVEIGFRVLLEDPRTHAILRTSASSPSRPVSAESTSADSVSTEALVVIGTDQGLSGSFNERLAEAVAGGSPRPEGGGSRLLLVLGTRTEVALRERGVPIAACLPAPSSPAGVPVVLREILRLLETMRENQGLDGIGVVHNRTAPQGDVETVEHRILPLDPDWLDALAREPWPSRCRPTHSMGTEPLISALTRTLLFGSLHRAVAASLESETRHRLFTMQTAERNIEALLDDLSGAYRRERQEEITRELMEVVSGYQVIVG